MAISKTRMIYVGVLTAALAVLAWDKTRPQATSAPQKAAAQPDNPARRSVTSAPAPEVAYDLSAALADSYAALVDSADANEAGPRGETRDVFTPSRRLREALAPAPASTPTESAPPPMPAVQLTSILANGSGGAAIINGQVLQPGQSHEGVELLAVYPDHVVVVAAERRLLVYLDRPAEIVP